MKTYDICGYSEKRDEIVLLAKNVSKEEAFRVKSIHEHRFDNFSIDIHPKGVDNIAIILLLQKN